MGTGEEAGTEVERVEEAEVGTGEEAGTESSSSSQHPRSFMICFSVSQIHWEHVIQSRELMFRAEMPSPPICK